MTGDDVALKATGSIPVSAMIFFLIFLIIFAFYIVGALFQNLIVCLYIKIII